MEMIKEESKEEVKEESKEEESNRKRKLSTRKKIKSRKRRFIQNTSEDDSEKENMELDILTISPDLRKKKDDLNAIYQLVMDKYQDEIPEGFDRVLWGDLMVMFNPDDEDKFWNSQPDWNIVNRRNPLRKKVLLQMLELKLESEEDSTMALELIRFVKKLLAELEPEDSNGDEEDL
ncbi:hypothetical protein Tco_1142749 [Tanacetum coccineum]